MVPESYEISNLPDSPVTLIKAIMTSESTKTFLFLIFFECCFQYFLHFKPREMKKLRFDSCLIKFDSRKSLVIKCYMWIELCVWCFLTYSSIYHGKIFDYKYTETEDFVLHVKGGEGNESGNWYYRLMFGNLNLTNIDFENQRSIQGKMKIFI